jgi:phosphoenolpyruvate synthase/pyruvate phosphate dikinase
MNNLILNSTNSLEQLQQFAGGKALNLAKLEQHKIRVPEWFCFSSINFDIFIEHYQLAKQIHEITTADNYQEQQLTDLFLEKPLPPQLLEALQTALEQNNFTTSYLAVRSSGLDEDS